MRALIVIVSIIISGPCFAHDFREYDYAIMTKSECENFEIENPSTNCQLKMKTKCIMEPKVMEETIEFTECKVDKDLVKFVKVCKSYRSSSIQIPY